MGSNNIHPYQWKTLQYSRCDRSDFPDSDKVHMDIREGIDSIATFPFDLENKPSVTKLILVFPVLEVGLASETLITLTTCNIQRIKDTIES